MTGLGIIDTDLCIWGGNLTEADLEVARNTSGHPVIKTKPGPVAPTMLTSTEPLNWFQALICKINIWVNANPILAGVAIAGYYVALSRGEEQRKKRPWEKA